MKRASSEVMDLLIRNVPRDLVEAFDKAIAGEYSNRTEAIRDLLRRFARGEIARASKEASS